MGASLHAGLGAVSAEHADADAVLVMLADTPGVGPDVVRRLTSASGPDALARAAYGSEPGHPVLIGRDHWAGVLEVARGDRGARDYLRANPVTLVECADIGTGNDVDTAEALAQWRASLH
jgi:CTP:molybdopterin cytidylyltransferase MocA